jgi:hypothetical protein
MPPGHLACIVSRQARSADVGTDRIDRARSCDADVAHQGRTAIALAAYASALVIDEGARNAIKIGVGLEREPRPLRRVGAARAAGATDVGVFVHLPGQAPKKTPTPFRRRFPPIYFEIGPYQSAAEGGFCKAYSLAGSSRILFTAWVASYTVTWTTG